MIDAVTEQLLAGPVPSLEEALQAAHRFAERGGKIWQQIVDKRGRPLGPMMRIG